MEQANAPMQGQFSQPRESMGRSGLSPLHVVLAMLVVVSSLVLLATPYYSYSVFPAMLAFLTLVLWWKPQFGLYLILFFVPFDAYRALIMPSTYSQLTISKVTGFLLIAILFIQLALTHGSAMRLRANLWRPLALLLVAAGISIIFSQYELNAMNELRKFLTAVLIFALTLLLVSERGFMSTLPKVVVFSICIGVVLSVVGYFFGWTAFMIAGDSYDRVTGTGLNPNHFALMVLVTMPFLAHWIFDSSRPLVKAGAAALFFTNVAALVLTYSRGAAIISLVTFVLLIREHGKKFRPRYFGFVCLAALIGLLCVLYLVPADYWQRQKSISTQDSSVSSRISYIKAAQWSLEQRPIIGVGVGSYDVMYSYSPWAFIEGWNRRTRDQARRDAHNTYLEILVGTGVVGFIFYAAMIVLGLRNFNRAVDLTRYKRLPELKGMIKAYRMAFLIVLAYYFMLSSVYSRYFWVLLAVSVLALRLAKSATEKEIDDMAANY